MFRSEDVPEPPIFIAPHFTAASGSPAHPIKTRVLPIPLRYPTRQVSGLFLSSLDLDLGILLQRLNFVCLLGRQISFIKEATTHFYTCRSKLVQRRSLLDQNQFFTHQEAVMQLRKLTVSSHSGGPSSSMSNCQWPPSAISQTPYPLRTPGASEMLPRLYVSDLTFAESPAALATLGITHILSAMRGFVAISPELPIHHAQYPLEDLPFSELAAHLPSTTAFISTALHDPNARVLVHCMEGVSRSTSVVCAFLIAEYGWTPTQAIQYVKTRRRSAEPNFGFVQQLEEYANSLRHQS